VIRERSAQLSSVLDVIRSHAAHTSAAAITTEARLLRSIERSNASVASFADLLRSAVTEQGTISSAYRQFHNYSIGNQLLAWSQCVEREIQPGPLSTFMGWKDKGRHVKKVLSLTIIR
jgi:hypothetical protein